MLLCVCMSMVAVSIVNDTILSVTPTHAYAMYTQIGEVGSMLSGGQRARIALARALVSVSLCHYLLRASFIHSCHTIVSICSHNLPLLSTSFSFLLTPYVTPYLPLLFTPILHPTQIRDPLYLLLDEATSALDRAGEGEVIRTLLK